MSGGSASNADVYNWDEEYGEVGSAIPELEPEQMLFGIEHHI